MRQTNVTPVTSTLAIAMLLLFFNSISLAQGFQDFKYNKVPIKVLLPDFPKDLQNSLGTISDGHRDTSGRMIIDYLYKSKRKLKRKDLKNQLQFVVDVKIKKQKDSYKIIFIPKVNGTPVKKIDILENGQLFIIDINEKNDLFYTIIRKKDLESPSEELVANFKSDMLMSWVTLSRKINE